MNVIWVISVAEGSCLDQRGNKKVTEGKKLPLSSASCKQVSGLMRYLSLPGYDHCIYISCLKIQPGSGHRYKLTAPALLRWVQGISSAARRQPAFSSSVYAACWAGA